MKDEVELIRINTDDNPTLAQQLSIEALLYLQIYKNKALVWENTGTSLNRKW